MFRLHSFIELFLYIELSREIESHVQATESAGSVITLDALSVITLHILKWIVYSQMTGVF